MRLTVHPRSLLLVLLGAALLLVLVSLVGTLWGLATPGGVPFDGYERLMQALAVDEETTVPAWFSASLLLLCALLLLDVARSAWGARDRSRWHWTTLVVVFAYLSADEASQLHETGSALLDRGGVDVGLRFAWVVVAAPLVVLFVAAMAPFLLRLPRRTAVRFVVAGAVFVGGSLGLELVGGAVADATYHGSAPYTVVSSMEELCEMVGAALFARAGADHQRRRLAAADATGMSSPQEHPLVRTA